MIYTKKTDKVIRKIQLAIARKIFERRDCAGISCSGMTNNGIKCPLWKGKFDCRSYPYSILDKPAAVAAAAETYIKANQKKSKKEILKRVKKLEEKVDGLEISSELHECKDITDAKNLKKMLESDILSLVAEYEEKTGLKVKSINLRTGPFLELNLFPEEPLTDYMAREVKRNHHVKVTVNL